MPPVEFETAIPAGDRPQPHATDRAATAIVMQLRGRKLSLGLNDVSETEIVLINGVVCMHTAILPSHLHKIRTYLGLSHYMNVKTVKLNRYVRTFLMMLDLKTI